MENEAALPETEQVAASTEPPIEAELTPEQLAEKEPKPEKTDAERERIRMQRGIDRRTRQLEEARAESRHLREQLTNSQKGLQYQSTADDSEPLSLTRAQISELVKAEATKLAPTLRDDALEAERRQGVVKSLAKSWGQEKFDIISDDLDTAFDGLVDRRTGQPKPAIEAVFEADNPVAVIEFLTNPENDGDAEKLSRMSASQAGRFIANLEAKLSKPDGKPKASKAPAPLESVRRSSAMESSGLSDDLPADEWLARRNKELREKTR